MHRRWMSLPLLTSCVTAFYPYHEKTDDGVDPEKRFIPYHPQSQDLVDGVVTIDIKKLPKRDNTFPVVLSNPVSAPNSMPVSQDGSDYSYFSVAQFGSKGQNMYMLIDTGSANTWVMGQDCTSKACTIHNTFGKADSTTLNTTTKSWSLTYGTGSVSGVVASDTVKFAGFSLNMGFGLATSASDDFNNYPMDGILGLGRSTSNELGTPTVMEVLNTQGKLGANIVAVHLNRASDQSKDGEITFGGVDTSKFSGSLTYTKTANSGAWEIPVDDAYVNGNACKLTGKTAIIDTGTSYILMPLADATTLHDLIPGSAQNGESFTVPCDSAANVQFSFSGVKFSVSPKDFVGKSTSGNTCASNIIGHQAFSGNEWILGDVFLKNVYAVFDFDGSRIGFGMPGSGGSSSGSSSSSSSASSASGSSTALASATSSTSSQHSSTMVTSVSGSSSTTATHSATGTSSAAATASSAAQGSPYDMGSGSTATTHSAASSMAISSNFSLILITSLAFFLGILL